MAYALFANRKLYYTNLVFTLQSQLDNISQQKQSLLNFSGNIADGKITVEEIAADPTNFNNYSEYLQGADAYINTADDEGGAATSIGEIGSMAAEQNNSEDYLATIAEMLNESVNEEYAKQYSKKLEAVENQLDLQQQKIETKLSVAEKQLEAVESAEGDAIDKATPKYTGVG
jgi:hypothetical protein